MKAAWMALLILMSGTLRAELVAMDDVTLSEAAGQEGLSVVMEIKMKGSFEFQQTRGGETHALALSKVAINGTGLENATSPAMLFSHVDLTEDGIVVQFKTAQFSIGIKDIEMKQGIRPDGSVANVSRFGSAYALGFDMSKSFVELSTH
ncbi:DUF6160 family protein [Chitinivorax sp. B]|uniref:DUF6160 family protein n=1 Tax=Chitinivorax sp. B TaxID=2502235 RepID=UPI0010F78116|nr:DUF6160 family protein [Chitinivorax sp. B]